MRVFSSCVVVILKPAAATTDRYANGSFNHNKSGYTLFPLPSCSIIGVHFGAP